MAICTSCHFLFPWASGRIRTLNRRIMSLVFCHCAIGADPCSNLIFFQSLTSYNLVLFYRIYIVLHFPKGIELQLWPSILCSTFSPAGLNPRTREHESMVLPLRIYSLLNKYVIFSEIERASLPRVCNMANVVMQCQCGARTFGQLNTLPKT